MGVLQRFREDFLVRTYQAPAKEHGMKITTEDVRAFKFTLVFALIGLIYYVSSTLSDHQAWGMRAILMVK